MPRPETAARLLLALALTLGTWISPSRLAAADAATMSPVDYDIVYVRAPRYGDEVITKIPEVKDPILAEPGSDLILLHPDGTEEVLVAGGDGAVLDPCVSFDGKWVYFSKIHDQTELNGNRRSAAYSGADIFKLNLETRELIQLTFQEWTPNTGVANWSLDHLTPIGSGESYLGYGIFNLGACPLPGGKVIFTSSRNGFLPNKLKTFPNMQLYVMDEDGSNVEQIGFLNLGSALHPTVLMDGRVMFSTYESQGLRDPRVWGLWYIWPDGRQWGPLMSAFSGVTAFHWQTQLSDGRIVVEEYYNQNNAGFGTFVAFPATVPDGAVPFGKPDPAHPSNSPVQQGWHSNGKARTRHYPFSPLGLESLTPFTWEWDRPAPMLNGGGSEHTGKVTQPSAAPANDLLLVWSPGPAHTGHRPAFDAGIYLLPGGEPVHDHRELVLVKNDPDYNEQQPRAVLPYRAIYGADEPLELSWLPNDGSAHSALPAGTPYGLVGTSTFYRRNSAPGTGHDGYNGLDVFNASGGNSGSNWTNQGSDAGRYDNEEIYAVRLLAMEPQSHFSYGPYAQGLATYYWRNHANERLRILGEIPLLKLRADGSVVHDSDGNPDTSFLAKVPADVPFTFQTLDREGRVLNAAQTWHQVRPGEVRTDCGGCHAHSEPGLGFETTAAARPDYSIPDLANTTPLLAKSVHGQTTLDVRSRGSVDVEYYRDIKPILHRSCVGCHSKQGQAAAGLVLDDEEPIQGYEGTWHRLANDPSGKHGIPPLAGRWHVLNASRYIRQFQSRRSLLVWKVFGRRLDGWSNEDHPSAAIPGVASSLPGGGSKLEVITSDIDSSGTICPPPDSGVVPLSAEEKMTFARWVDLGAPISQPVEDEERVGWFADEIRPTLTVSTPRAGVLSDPPEQVRVGMHDFNTGLDMASFSVKADFSVNGEAPETELASLFAPVGDHIWALALDPGTSVPSTGAITVSVRDRQGNVSSVRREFRVIPAEPPGLNIVAIIQSVSETSGTIEAFYSADGDLTAVSGARFSLFGTIIEEPDLRGQVQFAGVPPGPFTIEGSLLGPDGNPIAGTQVSASGLLEYREPPPVEGVPVTLPVVARDQHGEEVTGASLYVEGMEDVLANGALVEVRPGSSIYIRGDKGPWRGAWVRQEVGPDDEELTIPFWRSSLVARDQTGSPVEGAELYVHRDPDSPRQNGASLVLPRHTRITAWASVGGLTGTGKSAVFSEGLAEVVLPIRRMRLEALDQHGALVPAAALTVYGRDDPVAPGAELLIPEGVRLWVRGRLGLFSGAWVPIELGDSEDRAVVPFRRLKVVASDEQGSAVAGADVGVRGLSEKLRSGSTLTVPEGMRLDVRGSIDSFYGDWHSFDVSELLDRIEVPFRHVRLVGIDQAQMVVPDTELTINSVDSVPSDTEVLAPEGASLNVQGRIGALNSPLYRFVVEEDTERLEVPFARVSFMVRDLDGVPVPGAQLSVWPHDLPPIDSALEVVLPVGSRVGIWVHVSANKSWSTLITPPKSGGVIELAEPL